MHADVQGGWEDVEVGYLVGRGSTGSVYRATCNGQQVAVKVSICHAMHVPAKSKAVFHSKAKAVTAL